MLALCLSAFAACDSGTPDEEMSSPLSEAKAYVYNTYKNSSEVYVADYKVIGKVVVGDVTYTVEWTTDASEENVKIVPGDDGMVTIDINEKNPEEVSYTLTATIKDDEGNTETVTLNRRTPAAIIIDEGMSYEEIVEAAYKLEAGIAMEGTYRLFGEITSIDTAWSDDYQNITVTIQVGDLADKPIMCYRLAGDGAKDLAVGDKITVEGTLKNYNGTIEFDAGCQLLGVDVEIKDQTAILDAAYKLEVGIAMTEEMTLTGVISAINTPWSEDYQNITVTMVCDGDTERPIMCYRLKGEGAADLVIGDTITVTGILKNYNGTIEFDAACNLDNVVKTGGEAPVAPEDPVEIVNAGYALAEGESLPYSVTLTGVITTIDTPYSTEYNNITVTIVVEGCEDKPIMCFRLKGDGAAELAVGDTITVTGIIKNYSGTIEFNSGCVIDSVVKLEAALYMAPGYFARSSSTIDPKDIVDAAYALEVGASLSYSATLTGEITAINTAYSESYKNITVTIAVSGREDKPIMCYRLKGDGADEITVGDTITVTGTLKNYNGTIEFDSGCSLDNVVKGQGTAPEAPSDPKDIVDAAYALEAGTSLPYNATLTGKITSIDTPYSESYKNITVTISVSGREDKPIMCYRLKGDGAAELAVGDTITVTGTLKNYNGTIEFDSGCSLDNVVKGQGEVPEIPSDPKDIVDAAYALEAGEKLPYNATLTGKVVSIDTPYSEDYKNITVTIVIEGADDKPIVCFRLKGDDADKIAVGDTVAVSGQLMNYDGTVEFGSGCVLQDLESNSPQTGFVEVTAIIALMLIAGAAIVTFKKKTY